jgi:hypothetical protein
MLKRATPYPGDDINEMWATIAAPLFYVSDVKALVEEFVDESPARLPANPCWIEHSPEFCVVFWQPIDSDIEWLMFALVSKAPSVVAHVAMGDIINEDGGLSVNIDRKNLRLQSDEKTLEDIEKCVGASAYVAKLFASLESSTIEVPLSAGRKMHARQGKGGMFRHYELDLTAARRQAAERQSHGGTHASPAWHIRRGHMRTLKDGRRIFIRSCEVGSKERGVVLKDYVVGV